MVFHAERVTKSQSTETSHFAQVHSVLNVNVVAKDDY